MNYMEKYKLWLESDVVDEHTKTELKEIGTNEAEIEDRFFKDLEFGTGGLRGVIGAGSNRMNMYTVGKATQGLANYILKHKNAAEKGVVIAYDSRFMSREFAAQTALVLNANGIKAYIYSELQPTPLLSFSVRELGAVAGVVVTASHNPPEYNGYKVYWQDGAQVVGVLADDIIKEVNLVERFEDVKTMPLAEAKNTGLYNVIDESVINTYVSNVKSLCLNGDIISKTGSELTIVYTPLHGAGNKLVRRVLTELGFENVYVVPEQELPDSKFSTVSYPNPEDPEAFKLAFQLAKIKNADIIIATDPDCDRVGVAVNQTNGDYKLLDGNQTGALLVNFLLENLAAKKSIPLEGVIIKTIVTSELTKKMATAFGLKTIDTYTGFKYIAREILKMQEKGEGKYIFGFEESFGYMPSDFVRDKDAVATTALVCEMLSWYKSRDMSLYEGLVEIWGRYGFYKEHLITITMKGKEGIGKINGIMSALRKNPPFQVAGFNVSRIDDYKTLEAFDVSSNSTFALDMEETSDVLRYTLENDWWFAIRPSGTEPKAKVYISVVGSSIEDAENKLNEVISDVSSIIDSKEG